MQRTVSIKLSTMPAHDAALSALATEFATGCNLAADIAARERITNRVKLHHHAYYLVREQTRLGAQMACNACGQIAERKRHRLVCSCGNRAHADVNAASNLARLGVTAVASRGVVNRPDVAA